MLVAKVLGHATATVKHFTMNGSKLLLVQPLMADENSPDGDPLLVVDRVGAGRGDLVMITSDGRSAREAMNSDKTPVRWTAIGIRD